jgi:hypothetical protein
LRSQKDKETGQVDVEMEEEDDWDPLNEDVVVGKKLY